ncbi:MAG: hypothetical protein QNJ72_27425 [Pleurocapsa sp. MO_226.B13]|nr:hypothetical protein [Pleurocapsa sp. MO_226.B13]
MGEAKRRKKLDSNYGKPVRVRIEKSNLTGKWLVVAYILSRRTVITPHYLYDDAVAAAEQVFQRFNTLSIDEWRKFLKGDRTVLSKAVLLLDYDDDDEIVGVIRGDLSTVDEDLVVDYTKETREKATSEANKISLKKTGRPF